MDKNNWLASFFNNAGEVFEKFNPAAFRFLAAFLPYMTPIPVAWITMHSAGKFLSFDPWVSFVFVFGLEGIGLWFTALFVDSVVTAIRSQNIKAWVTVGMFAIAVTVYITILVRLNVTIETATNNNSPAYSQVITLLCFLPLITGIGNGYYKLALESATAIEEAQEKQDQWQREQWKTKEGNKQQVRLAKAGINPLAPAPVVLQQVVDTMSESRVKKASDYKEKIWRYLDEQYSKGKVLGVKEITEHFSLPYDKAKGFVSTQRTLWARERGVQLH
jgi:hypothetical protein